MYRAVLVFLFGTFFCRPALAGSEVVDHPVYPVQGGPALHEAPLARLLDMSEDDMLKLVPEKNGLRFCGCPNCEGGRQECGIIAWNGPEDPDHVHCRYCGMVYPNDKYPMNKTREATNRLGKKETWRYYEDEGEKNQYYFAAAGRYIAKHYMAERAYNFAAVYHRTKKEPYARRAVLLLARFSEVYPQWNVMHDYPAPGKKHPVSDAKPPYPYWGGIWNRWFYCDVPVVLLKTYDPIYDSGQLEKIGSEKGVDLKKQIEDGMFHAAVRFVRTYRETYGNMSPNIYQGLIVAGRILNRPDYVHDGIARTLAVYRAQFFFEGMWREGTTAYDYQTIGGLKQCLRVAKGYCDPPGYRCKTDGSRLDNVDLEKQLPVIARANKAPLLLVFPNGKVVPIHDTWSNATRSTEYAAGPALLADLGHARLGCGTGENMIQTHLHFSGGYGHQHADSLNLILFAKGRELLSDIGYTWTRWRFWAGTAASHNTVAIDGKSHRTRGRGGKLTLYSALAGPVQAVEAIQPNAYPDIADEFRRRLFQVQITPDDAYVVDVFHVQGGKQHEYFLHGSSNYPQKAEVSLALKQTLGTLIGPDVEFKLPGPGKKQGRGPRGMFKNLRETTTDGPLQITWRFDGEAPARLRTTILGQSGSRVILAETPQIRPAKENDGDLPDHWRPSLVVQRQGPEKLASTFVAVHEPFVGEPLIQSVKRLVPLDENPVDPPVAIAVTHRTGTDYVVLCRQACSVTVELDKKRRLACHARIGLVRERKEKVASAYLCDGREISLGTFTLKCPPSPTGRIETINRDEAGNKYSLVVTGKLPSGGVLHGHTIIVTHPDKTTHGYLIESVEPRAGKAVVHLRDDPGFDYVDGKTRFLFYPQREVEGASTYRIDRVAVFEDGRI